MADTFRAKIRMYRQGLGDCLLITLPGKGAAGNYFILIDCGVILGTENATATMTSVMDDIRRETRNHVNLLVATHEHWDHLSGFVQAKDSFAKLTADEVWMAWTEDPADELGRKLSSERGNALNTLRMSASRLESAGESIGAQNVSGVLDFFGAARGPSTRDALEAVRGKSTQVRYCRPDDPPTLITDTGVRIYVLGPPRDEKLIRKTAPSASNPQTYELAANAFASHVAQTVCEDAPQSPFGPMFAIPWTVAQELPHLRDGYLNSDSWRRIDSAWLDDATSFALALDSATNNTSLVLAIELPGQSGMDGDVLLFAADAQVGNWLSWQDLKWNMDGRTVTGPDLLRRTRVYKVGHHGSHNATLKERGLEEMVALQCALLPVNEAMAQRKHWGRMPLPSLLEALSAQTDGAVIRSDAELPAGTRSVEANPLWFELTV